jgi:hypothetical protein
MLGVIHRAPTTQQTKLALASAWRHILTRPGSLNCFRASFRRRPPMQATGYISVI